MPVSRIPRPSRSGVTARNAKSVHGTEAGGTSNMNVMKNPNPGSRKSGKLAGGPETKPPIKPVSHINVNKTYVAGTAKVNESRIGDDEPKETFVNQNTAASSSSEMNTVQPSASTASKSGRLVDRSCKKAQARPVSHSSIGKVNSPSVTDIDRIFMNPRMVVGPSLSSEMSTIGPPSPIASSSGGFTERPEERALVRPISHPWITKMTPTIVGKVDEEPITENEPNEDLIHPDMRNVERGNALRPYEAENNSNRDPLENRDNGEFGTMATNLRSSTSGRQMPRDDNNSTASPTLSSISLDVVRANRVCSHCTDTIWKIRDEIFDIPYQEVMRASSKFEACVDSKGLEERRMRGCNRMYYIGAGLIIIMLGLVVCVWLQRPFFLPYFEMFLNILRYWGILEPPPPPPTWYEEIFIFLANLFGWN